MDDLCDKRRLYDDRKLLYYRLMRIGFIPDKDMRKKIDEIRTDLYIRIIALGDEIMAGELQ